MEALLRKRLETLALPALAILMLAAAGVVALWPESTRTSADTIALVQSLVKESNSELSGRISEIRARALDLAGRYSRGERLPAPFPREALVKVKQGRIQWHHGVVFVSPYPHRGEKGAMLLERRGDQVYLVQYLDDTLRYVAPLLDVKANFILQEFPFPLVQKEIRILRTPMKPARTVSQYDEQSGVFVVSASFAAASGRLVVNLKFLQSDVRAHYRHVRSTRVNLMILVALALLLIWMSRFHGVGADLLKVVVSLGFAIRGAMWLAPVGQGTIFIQPAGFPMGSIFSILVLCLWLYLPVHFLFRRIRNPFMAVILAHLILVGGILLAQNLLSSASFYFGVFLFNPAFLALLLIVFTLHILPFMGLRNMDFPRGLRPILFLFGLQAATVTCVWVFHPSAAVWVLIASSAVPVILLLRPGIPRRVLVLGLLALSISSMTASRSEANKREFISGNLRHVFLNQGNYAKLIAREIVHEMNLAGDDLTLFFRPEGESLLRDLWRNSLAAKESIPSGIYVLSRDLTLMNEFSHQIPYVPVKRSRFFPVWALEDSRAFLFGREISLAQATIAVYDAGKLLGHLVIQVLNSPELILRQRDEHNIFALDPRLGRMPMNYIILNSEMEIIDNPGRVNVRDVGDLFRNTGGWVRFSHNDAPFSGYVFPGGSHRTMIYYRVASPIHRLAGWIRILLFCFLISLIPDLRDLRLHPWKRFFNSFSVRVFAILMLIALLTGVVFSIFSLNFYRRSMHLEHMSSTYQQGRMARNVVDNFMGEGSEITQNQVFFLSRMIGGDVTVFQDGEREFTSDIRQILRGRVPEHLDSQVLELLNLRNQRFVVHDHRDYNTLYFRNGKTIFQLDFPVAWSGMPGGGSYANFVTVMIFFLGIIGFAVALFFRDRILAPIQAMNRGMSEVEMGMLPLFTELPREHELQTLYQGFNAMIRGIQAQKRNISEISRMKTLVNLGRRVAHEVKNPLTPIKLSAEQIQRSLQDKREDYEKTIHKSVAFIIAEVEHLRKVSFGFLDLSRLDAVEDRDFNLPELLREEVVHFRQVYPLIRFSVFAAPEDFSVRLDPVKIRQMTKNILSNAVEAMGEEGGDVSVRVEKTGDVVQLVFQDNGMGMTAEARERIFDMGYSTKDSGTGLGMFIIQRIVELHGGHVNLKSSPEKGTEILIELPVETRSHEPLT